MMVNKGTYLILFCTAVLILLGSCFKEEYSYEGGAVPPPTDTTTETDTAQNSLPGLQCHLCKAGDVVQPMQWRFMYNGTTALCGTITKAVLSPGKNALTFFGPSACSVDTGLIMTVFLNTLLDQDRANVRATGAVLQYYNKNAAENVFDSRSDSAFMLTIDQFSQQTRVATGRFSGDAFTSAGAHVSVTSGTFNIQFVE